MKVYILKNNESIVSGYAKQEIAQTEARKCNLNRDPQTNDFHYVVEVEVIE